MRVHEEPGTVDITVATLDRPEAIAPHFDNWFENLAGSTPKMSSSGTQRSGYLAERLTSS